MAEVITTGNSDLFTVTVSLCVSVKGMILSMYWKGEESKTPTITPLPSVPG
jgi:hypothetical protein